MGAKEITIKENMQLVLEGKQPVWLPSFDEEFAFVGSLALGRKQNGKNNNVVDVFGTVFLVTPDGAVPDPAQHRLHDITKWREIMPEVDLSKIDWEEDARLIRAQYVEEGQLINYYAGYVWEQLHYMMGFEEALVSLLLQPDAVYECMDAIADFWIDAMRRSYKYLKPDFIMFFDHIATHQGLLMSPDVYRNVIKPVQKKVYHAIAELGAIPEMHVDGYIEDVIPDFVDVGVRAIQPFQVMNDINRYKDEYGLLAIGGWDAFGPGNMEDATEEEIRSSVRLSMDTYGPSGRYVFWNSGAIPRDEKHMMYLRDEALEYGQSFYSVQMVGAKL